MKRLTYLFVLVLFAMPTMQAQYLMGDFNAWSNANSMQEYFGYYAVTVEVTSDFIPGQFLVDQNADGVDIWGDATDSYLPTVNVSEGQMRGSISGDSPANLSMNFSNGKYYTFRLEGDETWWNRRFVVMETDAIPVDVLSVSDNSSTQNENDITVSITTSDVLSSQETVYLRYTTDGWSTSSIVACTGTGTSYSSIILGQSASTVVDYYVFTSAMEQTFVNANVDFSTLRANNNAGLNYTYTVTSASAYAVASVSSDLIENILDNAVIDVEIFNDTFDDATIDLANITLNNAPAGLTVFDVAYTDVNNISITLDFDGTDFSANISNFSITIEAAELSGTDPLTTNELIIYAYVLTEDFYFSKVVCWEGGANDVYYNDTDFNGHDFGMLNSSSSLYLKSGQAFVWKVSGGDVFSAKMFYRLYKDGDTPGAFVEQALGWESESVSNDTTYQIWWNDEPDETNLNLLESVTAGTYYVEVYFETENGDSEILTRNNDGLNYIAQFTYEESVSLTAVPSAELNSSSLNDMTIDLQLDAEIFDDATLESTNFTLNNAPAGLTISGVVYDNASSATLTLTYSGDPILTQIDDFSITVAAIELAGDSDLTSNNMTILADGQTIYIVTPAIKIWEGGAEDEVYPIFDFNGHDFGVKDITSSLYLKSGWTLIDIIDGNSVLSVYMYFRMYKDGDIPGNFNQIDLSYYSGIDMYGYSVETWSNEMDLNLLESLSEGRYFLEVYFEAEDQNNNVYYDNNNGMNYIAEFTWEDIPFLVSNPAAELNSFSLNNMEISLTLNNETFVDDVLESSNFVLNNEPAYLSINNVSYISDTEAEIILAYDGTEILTQIDNFSITVAAAELTGGVDLQSNNMTILADVEHEGIYMSKVSMWEGSGDDTWYDDFDFDGHDFGSFNSEMSLYFKTGQVFSWQDDFGNIDSAAMNYRIYKDGDTPGEFTNVDLPYHSEWVSGDNTDKLWWNDSPDEIDINIIDGIDEGTYFFEVYYEARTGEGEILYNNNEGANYIATFTYTSDPILTAVPEEALTEENLDGAVITLNIAEDFFADAILEQSNFSLNNAPVGTTISDVTYVGPYEATVTLAFDGTNFDTDIVDFSITVAADEFDAGGELTSNNITINAIDENITISTHLLTSDLFQRYLGDVDSYWINMEIGQLEWNTAEIGYGESSTVPDAWNWSNAEWYEDGEGNNKRVHTQLTIPNESGVLYYAGRVRNTEEGTWFYANSTDWSEADVLNAVYTIETLDLPAVESSSATMIDGTRINVEWTANVMFTNVIILAKEFASISTNPIQGTTYSVGELIDGAEVIYKGNAGNFMHTGLENNTTYNYKIYTLNNDYYSSGTDATASTDDSQGCTFVLDLGDDVNVCGGSSVLINTGLVVEPFGDTVTIYFNTYEHAEFASLTKVYLHAGVQLAGGSAWDYTVGNWGEDDGLGLMTPHDANTWKITFNPLEYFGYPIDSDLQGINLVFRNDDGTLVANNPDNLEDYYIDMSVVPPVPSHTTLTLDFIQSEIADILWSNGETSTSISVSDASEYSVIATDINGCVGMDTINVELHSLPYVELGEDQTVCGDTEIILDAGEFESYAWNVDSTSQTIIISEPGMYIVTVTDVYGCTGFDVVNVDMIDYPIAEFSYEFSDEFTVQFSDSSENATIYSWDFDGDDSEDSDLAGDVLYTYSDLGQYGAALTVSNQCGEDTYSTVIYVLDIDNNEIIEINVYPNPVSEYLTIELPVNNSDIRIKLFSIDGKLVVDEFVSESDRYVLDVTGFETGMYTLIIQSGDNKTENKIIIK